MPCGWNTGTKRWISGYSRHIVLRAVVRTESWHCGLLLLLLLLLELCIRMFGSRPSFMRETTVPFQSREDEVRVRHAVHSAVAAGIKIVTTNKSSLRVWVGDCHEQGSGNGPWLELVAWRHVQLKSDEGCQAIYEHGLQAGFG
jgi:hypothetical protein